MIGRLKLTFLIIFLYCFGDKYNPDTYNLLTDDDAREYSLAACKGLMERNVNYALANSNDPNVKNRILKYKASYTEVLKNLKNDRLAYGLLTQRLLFDINETCLHEHGFFDLWKHQKISDNDAAFAIFNSRLSEIDSITNHRERWIELCKGVLAGNMFDCGAEAVTEFFKRGFYEALQHIQRRPWLHDYLDTWLNKLESTVHRCAAIFVDNSGMDIVLGILPFVRALLKRGTSIILCANESPALNDVTYEELLHIAQRASLVCSIISAALAVGNLVIKSSGQKGPCLDLRTISQDLSTEMKTRGVDLIILEGMGRAVLTNLNTDAVFAVDCLKLAVVKGVWLAERLGGPLFSVILDYQVKSIKA